MLYNPKWDLMSLESLIAWLEQQPADGTYQWEYPNLCLMGCYLKSRTDDFASFRNRYPDMPHYREIAAQEPWTFGAALERAKAVQN
jgi:hypothetical protein